MHIGEDAWFFLAFHAVSPGVRKCSSVRGLTRRNWANRGRHYLANSGEVPPRVLRNAQTDFQIAQKQRIYFRRAVFAGGGPPNAVEQWIFRWRVNRFDRYPPCSAESGRLARPPRS
jgi:hypothetical protein